MAQKGQLDPNDSRAPVYQLADSLRAAYEPGAKLPHTDELTQSWHVSVTVVRRAVALLRDEGLVTSTPGIGTFYVAERPKPRTRPAVSTENELTALAQQAADLAKRLTELAKDQDNQHRYLP